VILHESSEVKDKDSSANESNCYTVLHITSGTNMQTNEECKTKSKHNNWLKESNSFCL